MSFNGVTSVPIIVNIGEIFQHLNSTDTHTEHCSLQSHVTYVHYRRCQQQTLYKDGDEGIGVQN